MGKELDDNWRNFSRELKPWPYQTVEVDKDHRPPNPIRLMTSKLDIAEEVAKLSDKIDDLTRAMTSPLITGKAALEEYLRLTRRK